MIFFSVQITLSNANPLNSTLLSIHVVYRRLKNSHYRRVKILLDNPPLKNLCWRYSSIHKQVCSCDQSSLMDWVLDPVDDVELVPDIDRVRSVGTRKKETREFSFTMSQSRGHNLGFAPTKSYRSKRQLSNPCTVANPVHKAKLFCNTPHRRSTTVSFETYPLYSFLGRQLDPNTQTHD